MVALRIELAFKPLLYVIYTLVYVGLSRGDVTVLAGRVASTVLSPDWLLSSSISKNSTPCSLYVAM